MILAGVDQTASWVVIVSFAIGVLAGVPAVVAYVRHGTHSETVKLQREEIEAQGQRIDTLSEEKKDQARLLATQQGDIRTLRSQVEMLTELVTQQAKVDQLREQVANQHGEVMTALERLTAALTAAAVAIPTVVTVGPPGMPGGRRQNDPPEPS